MIDLQNKRNFVRVLTCKKAENPQGAGDTIRAAFDCEFDDVLWVKKCRVLGERCARRVLDALVDREDRSVTGVG